MDLKYMQQLADEYYNYLISEEKSSSCMYRL